MVIGLWDVINSLTVDKSYHIEFLNAVAGERGDSWRMVQFNTNQICPFDLCKWHTICKHGSSIQWFVFSYCTINISVLGPMDLISATNFSDWVEVFSEFDLTSLKWP